MVYCESCGAANETITEKCSVCLKPVIDTEELEIVSPLASADIKNEYNESEHIPELLHDRYQILQEVGTGGFGAVYKAIDTQSDNRTVAIKEIRLQGLKPNEVIDATDTFNREVSILSDLRHPNLPRVYDHFTAPEHWYLVMDYIEGQTLEAYLAARGGRLSLDDIFSLGIQICTVLDYLHTRQPAIIFRDLKPTNVMITANKQAFLIDFGAARYFKTGRTKDTIAFGSPGYAAPEQYGKAQTTARSDIYSLGATLHEALTGKDPAEDPFHFASVLTVGKTLPPDLDTLILRMVEMDMGKRPTSAATVKTELQRISTQYTHRLYAQPFASSTLPYRPNFGVGQPPPASWSQSAPSVQQAQIQLGFTPTPAPRKRVFSRRAATSMIILGIASVALLENARALWPSPYNLPQSGVGQGIPRFTQQLESFPLGSFTHHTNTVTALDWSPMPNGNYIASGSLDKTLRIWNQNIDGTEITHSMPDGVQAVRWSPDGAYIAAGSSGKIGELQIWNALAKSGEKSTFQFSAPSSGAINALTWSPLTQTNSYSIALGSADGQVRVINSGAPSFSSPTTYTGPKDQVLSLSWSPDGNFLAAGSADTMVYVWPFTNLNGSLTSKPILPSLHTDRVTALAWVPDRSILISGGADRRVQVWDIGNGQALQNYQMSGPVSTLSVSSRNVLAVGTEDATVTLYDLFGSNQSYTLPNKSQSIRSLAWSQDGSYLAIGGDDRQVTLWNIIVQTIEQGDGPGHHHHWGK